MMEHFVGTASPLIEAFLGIARVLMANQDVVTIVGIIYGVVRLSDYLERKAKLSVVENELKFDAEVRVLKKKYSKGVQKDAFDMGLEKLIKSASLKIDEKMGIADKRGS